MEHVPVLYSEENIRHDLWGKGKRELSTVVFFSLWHNILSLSIILHIYPSFLSYASYSNTSHLLVLTAEFRYGCTSGLNPMCCSFLSVKCPLLQFMNILFQHRMKCNLPSLMFVWGILVVKCQLVRMTSNTEETWLL